MSTSPRRCPSCDASAAGCQTVQSLAGRACCRSCDGDHEPSTTTTTMKERNR